MKRSYVVLFQTQREMHILMWTYFALSRSYKYQVYGGRVALHAADGRVPWLWEQLPGGGMCRGHVPIPLPSTAQLQQELPSPWWLFTTAPAPGKLLLENHSVKTTEGWCINHRGVC